MQKRKLSFFESQTKRRRTYPETIPLIDKEKLMYDMLGCKDNAKRKKPEGAGEAECAKPGGTEKYPEKKRKVARLRNGVQPHTKRHNQRSVGALASVLDAPVSQKPVPPLLVPAAGGRAEDPRPSGTSPIPPCPPGFFLSSRR